MDCYIERIVECGKLSTTKSKSYVNNTFLNILLMKTLKQNLTIAN